MPDEAAPTEFFLNASTDVFIVYTLRPAGDDDAPEPRAPAEAGAPASTTAPRRMQYSYVNEACCAMLARPREEVLGRTNTELFGEEAARDIDVHVRRCFDERSRVSVEHVLRLPGGDKVFDTVYTYTRHGTSEFVFGVCRDITWRKEAEVAADRARQAAEDATNTKTLFLANMSHDLRTPLVGINNVADALKATPLNDEQRELVDILNTSSHVLLTLVNDISDITKVEQNKLTLEPNRFSVTASIKACTAMIGQMCHDKGLTLHQDLQHEQDCVLMDEMRLRQILYNLLSNAVKYTHYGSVTLRTSTRANPVEEESERWPLVLDVKIEDTGVGISAEQQNDLFKPFSQITSGKDDDERAEQTRTGSGLGLAIAQRLAKMMGGIVTVESVVGEGSTFTIQLPLLSCAHVDDHSSSNEDHSNSTHYAPLNTEDAERLRVLIAEDCQINQRVLCSLLRQRGLKDIKVVPNGQEAVNALLEDPAAFHLVFMDRNMPVLDGLGATRKLRTLLPSGKQPLVVFLTAAAMNGDSVECLSSGADVFQTKPISTNDLSHVLGLAVRKKLRPERRSDKPHPKRQRVAVEVKAI